MLKALIFDFDGLILDTETPEVIVWQNIYKEHGFELPFDEWIKIVGGYGASTFDAAAYLAHLSSGKADATTLAFRSRQESDIIIQSSPIMPGVLDLIQAAKSQGLKVAIGSSSPHRWVDSHTKRLGIYDLFDFIICQDDVQKGRTKPHPDIYLKALAQLQIRADEAVVFEDSVNGVMASRQAGIFVVAVPNSVTKQINVQGDLTVSSLAELTLQNLMAELENA